MMVSWFTAALTKHLLLHQLLLLGLLLEVMLLILLIHLLWRPIDEALRISWLLLLVLYYSWLI